MTCTLEWALGGIGGHLGHWVWAIGRVTKGNEPLTALGGYGRASDDGQASSVRLRGRLGGLKHAHVSNEGLCFLLHNGRIDLAVGGVLIALAGDEDKGQVSLGQCAWTQSACRVRGASADAMAGYALSISGTLPRLSWFVTS